MGGSNLKRTASIIGVFALFLVPRVLMLGDARWTSEESWFFADIVATAQGER